MLTVIIAVVLAALYLLYAQRPKIHRNGKRLARPPNTLPFLGNGIKFIQSRHVLFHWFVKCEQQFGAETFEISVPSLPPGIVINDPQNLEYVLKHEGVFTKGDFFRRRSYDLFGNGIINTDGPLWKAQRKAGNHFLSNTNLSALVEVVLPQYFAEIRRKLQVSAETGDEVNLEGVFLELTTSVMGRMAYDMDISSSSPFSKAFDHASDKIGRRFQNPFYFLTEIFTGSEFRSALTDVSKYGKNIVSSALERREKALAETKQSHSKDALMEGSAGKVHEPGTVVYGSLIDSLLDTISDRKVVADAALNFLSAGRDTTAQALTWTFYLLMRHPQKATKIRDEINSILSQDTGSTLTAKNLQPAALPYSMAVFDESLRLYPPVPFEIKQCEAPTTLPDGTFLPQGSIVVWCVWSMNRSRRLWGDDADVFRPERWLENNDTDSRRHRVKSKTNFEFPVFNGGPRSCLGRKMAELLAVYTIANLVREFDFHEADSRSERISKNSLTLPMEGGLPCFVKVVADSAGH